MTPKERAAMQQALEALHAELEAGTCEEFENAAEKCYEAITALREALAGDNMSPTEQAEQEPIRLQCTTCGTVYADGVPPQVKQAEQEPVAWHHPQCDGQCIACLIEKAVQDAYGTQGRDYMLRHINAAAPFNCKGKCCE